MFGEASSSRSASAAGGPLTGGAAAAGRAAAARRGSAGASSVSVRAGIAADELALVEAAQLAGVGHLADHGVRRAPSGGRPRRRRRPARAGRRRPSAPGSRRSSPPTARDRPRAAARGRGARRRRRRRAPSPTSDEARPGRAAVLERLDEAALDELDSETSISFLPVNGSPICTDGRFSPAPSPSSWLASTLAPPIPSRPVVAP